MTKMGQNGTEVSMNGINRGNDDTLKNSALCGSHRLLVSFLGCLCFLILLGQRAAMSIAIVCMVNHTALSNMAEDNSTTQNNGSYDNVPPGCGFSLGSGGSTMEDGPFVWSKSIQGFILSSFFFGYFLSQFPVGIIAERLSPKWVFTFCYGMAIVANFLTPVAAKVHYIFLIVVRVFAGMGTSATFPCMHAVLSRWAAPFERSRLTNLSYSGVIGGGVVGMMIAGVLCKHGFGQGWDSIFYVLGIAAIVSWVLWLVLTSSSPAENRFVKSRERLYLLHQLKGQVSSGTTKDRIPVCDMLKSGPVWAIVAANFFSDWGLYTLVANIPSYLNEVHYFDIQSNGLISAFPFIGFAANMFVSPMIADKLMASGTLSTTAVRKLFNTIGMVSPAGFILGLSFIKCTQPILAIVLLTLAGTMSGCYGSGYLINHIEIAPKFAGTLVGITNGVAGTSGFIAPSIAAALTPDGTRRQWQRVFYLASAMYLLGAIIYCILGSAEIQPWAKETNNRAEGEGEETVELKDPLATSDDITILTKEEEYRRDLERSQQN